MRITNQHTIKGNTITNQHTIKENTHHQPTYHKREYATKTIKQQKRIPMPNNNITKQKRIQCHESFYPFFIYKLYLGPNEQANVISRNFLVFAKIFAKKRALRSHWLHRHGVRVVVDSSVTTMTMRTSTVNFGGLSLTLKDQKIKFWNRISLLNWKSCCILF